MTIQFQVKTRIAGVPMCTKWHHLQSHPMYFCLCENKQDYFKNCRENNNNKSHDQDVGM